MRIHAFAGLGAVLALIPAGLSAQKPKAHPKPLAAQVADLQARLATLERQVAGQGIIQAPFTVIDKSGKPIFQVSDNPRGFTVLGDSGHVLLKGIALPTGGYIKTLAKDNARSAAIGAAEGEAVVALRDGETSASNRVVMVLSPDGEPSVVVLNQKHTGVIAMGTNPRGRGKLQIDNSAGEPRLEAGVTDADVGAVHAGPRVDCAVTVLEVPACIAGHR